MNVARLEIRARSDDILQYIQKYIQKRIRYSAARQSHASKYASVCNLISVTLAARAGDM